jgi:hypothetical protein
MVFDFLLSWCFDAVCVIAQIAAQLQRSLQEGLIKLESTPPYIDKKNLAETKLRQIYWCPRKNSNLQPFAPQADALSN